MNKKFEYLEKIKDNKSKAITISIDENLIKRTEEIANELEVSRNRIISEALDKLVDDYNKMTNPRYYIINASKNNLNITNLHLHMLDGNKISIFGGDINFTDEDLGDIEIGDYIFVWIEGYGIVGNGEVISGQNKSSYSIVETYRESGEKGYEVVDEWYMNIKYDRKVLEEDSSDSGLEKIKNILDLQTFISSLKEEYPDKYGKHNFFERRSEDIKDCFDKGDILINIAPQIGSKLKSKCL